jgi:hypothetical protein
VSWDLDSAGFKESLENAKDAGVMPATAEYSDMVDTLVSAAVHGVFYDEMSESVDALKSAANAYRKTWPDLLADVGYVSSGLSPRWEQKGSIPATTKISAEQTGDGSPTALNQRAKTPASVTLSEKLGLFFPIALAVPALVIGLYLYMNWRSWRKAVGGAVALFLAVAAVGAYAVYRALVSAYGVAE